MISVELKDNLLYARIFCESSQFRSHVQKLKSVGFKFDEESRAWWAPNSKLHVYRLVGAFKDQVAYRTPYEELLGLPSDTTDAVKSTPAEIERFKALLAGHLLVEPFAYQWEGACDLYSRRRHILGDEMGLGKTLQLVMAIRAGQLEGAIRRALVLVPADLKYQWQDEYCRYTGICPVLLDGDPGQREKIYASLPEEFVLVAGIELVRGTSRSQPDLERLLALSLDCVAVDEFHCARNRSSLTAKTLRKFNTPYFFGATGTPFKKDAEDVFSLMEIVERDVLGKVTEFRKRYVVYHFNGRYQAVVGYRHLKELAEKVSPYITRRRKEDVNLQLPEKIVQPVLLDMTDTQRRLYGLLDAREVELREALQQARNTEEAQKLDNQLQAVCTFKEMVADSPELVSRSDSWFSKDLKKLVRDVRSPKVDFIKETVAQHGGKIVVFTKYREFLEVLLRELKGLSGRISVIHGDTPKTCRTGEADCLKCKAECASRKKEEYYFNHDPSTKILLATDAAQRGRNLTAGDLLIHADLLWTPADLDQRTDRIHRATSTHRAVHILYLISKDSVEEHMYDRLNQRRSVGHSIIG